MLASAEATRMRAWLEACREAKESVAFISLTYDPSEFGGLDDPDCCESAWRASKDGKHVSRFMSRVEELSDVSLKGCWRAKMEFQNNGLIHYHILCRSWPYVDQRVLQEAWGWGIVHVQRAKTGHAEYIAKYQAKAGGYPEFLYRQARRSVKIWGTSPGFWKFLQKDAEQEPEPVADDVGDVNGLPQALDTMRKAWRESCASWDGDETIGEAIERANRLIVARDSRGNAIEGIGNMPTVAVCLTLMGCNLQGSKWGWFKFDNASLQQVELALRNARTVESLIKSEADYGTFWRHELETVDVDQEAEPMHAGGSRTRASALSSLLLIKTEDRAQELVVREHRRADLKLRRWCENVERTNACQQQSQPETFCGVPFEQWPDEVAPF